jgi:hypothetical protein
VAIKRFVWTDHAELRLGERGLTRSEVEDAIREGHPMREVIKAMRTGVSTACDPTVANSLSSTTTQPEGMRAQRAS